MEPRRDDGDDRRMDLPGRHTRGPQWSPVVTTGTTYYADESVTLYHGAAMEPRRDDGDDHPGHS